MGELGMLWKSILQHLMPKRGATHKHPSTYNHLLGKRKWINIDSNGTQWTGCAVGRQTPNSVPEHHPITRKEHKQKPGHDQSTAGCIRHRGIRRAGNWCQGTKDVITILATWSGISAITSQLLGARWSVPGAEDSTASADSVIHYPHVVPSTSADSVIHYPHVVPSTSTDSVIHYPHVVPSTSTDSVIHYPHVVPSTSTDSVIHYPHVVPSTSTDSVIHYPHVVPSTSADSVIHYPHVVPSTSTDSVIHYPHVVPSTSTDSVIHYPHVVPSTSGWWLATKAKCSARLSPPPLPRPLSNP